jgi:hypothetical protein
MIGSLIVGCALRKAALHRLLTRDLERDFVRVAFMEAPVRHGKRTSTTGNPAKRHGTAQHNTLIYR